MFRKDEYHKDRLTKIGHNGFHYQFFHDDFGNTSRVSIAGNDVISHTYGDHNGKSLKVVYGNGVRIRYEYDKEERVEAVYYQESSTASEQLYQSFVYGKDGSLDQVTDHLSSKTYDLDYDFLDRLMRVRDESGNYYEYTYDSENLMVHLVHGTADGRNVSVYSYDKDGREITTRMGTRIRTTEYDTLGRVKSQSWGLTNNPDAPSMATAYTYPVVNTTHEGNRPSGMTTPLGTYAYTYDANGNITEIVFTDAQNADVKRERYQYDELNQLIREDSESQGRTFIYHYDTGGNLTSVKEYAYTTGTPSQLLGTSTGTYQMQSMNASCEADCVHEEVAIADSERPIYSSGEVWKDQMVSWTDGATGETCAMTYDAIGNMRTKGSRTFEWKLGRKLAKVTEGALECSYDYDHTGNRVKKTVTEAGTTVTTLYRMAGDLLLSEKTGSETIWYEYDSGANLISMKLNGTRYFYIRNVQNDIVGLTDPSGTVVVRYEYNAWGKLLSITGSLAATIGAKNPFRYRGYYYDTETGMYYLKNRYYDLEIGRFISADGQISGIGGDINGYNLYSYCQNNPVNMTDPDGNWPKWVKTITSTIKKVANTIVKKVKSVVSSIKNTVLQAKKQSGKLPTKGEPGSSQILNNPDGTPKQKRWYGPDGNAERDRDYNHPGKDIPFPHDHVWDNGERSKDHLAPSPDYTFSLEPLLGMGLVGVCAIGIAVVAFDDFIGIGVVDDGLVAPLSAGVGKGLIMIFP